MVICFYAFNGVRRQSAPEPKLIDWAHHNEGGGQRCLASMDSDLEAFSRNPTDGSFVVLAFQLTTLTKYLNEVFLSY